MKKMYLLSILFVSFLGYSQAIEKSTVMQQDTPSIIDLSNKGDNINRYVENTPLKSENESQVVIITHNNSQNITPEAAVGCAGGSYYYETHMYRDFDLAGDFGITEDFEVTNAEIGIGNVSTLYGFLLTVNIYSTETGTFPGGILTLEGSSTQVITEATDVSNSILPFNISAVIPAGKSLILEAVILEDGSENNNMRFGANFSGQTGPTYIMANECGVNTITDLADLDLNNISWVANVISDENAIGGNCNGVVSENFEEGLPDGWSTVVNSGNCDWTFGSGDLPIGEGFSSNAVIFNDDDACGEGSNAPPSNVTLLSDVYNVTGLTYAYLTFDLAFKVRENETLSLEVFNGSTWEQFALFDESLPEDIQSFSYNLISYYNPDFQIRFTYNDNGGWGYHAGIDNFCFDYDEAIVPPDPCVVSEDFEDGLPEGWSTVINTGNCDWTFGSGELPIGDSFPTNAAIFNDDYACGEEGNAPPSNATLISDVYDTFGASYINLTVDIAFRDYTTGSFLLEAYNGTEWVEFALFEENLNYPDIQNFTFNLIDFANSEFQIRFTYDDGGDWGYSAGIDNFCLGYDEPLNCTVSETFEEGLPDDWTTVINTGNCDWTFGSGVLPIGDSFPSNAIIFNDDDACGEGNAAPASNVSLFSGVYNTNGSSSINLSVDIAFKNASNETFILQVYNGTSWITFDDFNTSLDPNIQTFNYDLSEYANSQFQIRFTYDDFGGWGWYAGIDNFCLDFTLGVNESDLFGFNFYPNPAEESINLNAKDVIENIKVFNMLGQKIIDQEINATSSHLNISNLTTGTYIMRVLINGQTGTYKIIKN